MPPEAPMVPRQTKLRQRYLELARRAVSYLERPGTPTLVLVPGSHQDYRQYLDLLAFLDPSLGIVIVELPGHRESRALPEDLSVEAFADDVLAVRRQLAPGAWYVGGHSIGGMVALEVARRHPAGLRGVIAIEGWTCAQAATDAFGDLDMVATLTPELRARQAQMRQQATGHLTAEERSRFSQVWTRWEHGESFLHITELPILELWGDRGRPRPTRDRLHFPERDNLHLHWIEGASHNLPLERPRELAEAIATFIQRLQSAY